MGQLTSREMIFVFVIIVLGLAFFAGVCVAIYYIFKRLARADEDALRKAELPPDEKR